MAVNIVCWTLTLVAITGTLTLAKPTDKTGNDVICCPPDRTNGTMYQEMFIMAQTGFSTIQNVVKMNVDYARKMIVIKGQSREGTVWKDVHFILTPNFSYDINDETKTCVIDNVVHYTPKHCLTDQAIAVGQVYFGDLKTTAYNVNTDGYSIFATMTDPDTCLVVTLTETVIAPGRTVVTNAVYSDLRATVDDSVFHIPSYCPI